jgi:hypothetical protein
LLEQAHYLDGIVYTQARAAFQLSRSQQEVSKTLMDENGTVPRLHQAVSWRGVFVSSLGLLVNQLSRWLDLETRYSPGQLSHSHDYHV